MMTSRIVLTVAVALCSSGCAYPGAVYTQYTQLNVMVAVRPEEAKPVDVNFGYGRGVVALVPKMKSDRHANEAASLLSKERVGTTIDVTDPKETNLSVDAAFISGNAAIVASLPDGSDWQIVAEDGTTVLYESKTRGEPGDRIQSAFKATAQFGCAAMKDVAEKLARVEKRTDKDEILDNAADNLPKSFRDAYAKSKAAGGDPRSAFSTASQRFTVGEPACGSKYLAVASALKNALK